MEARADPAAALQMALALHHAGRIAEAQAGYRAILAAHPRHFDALHLCGVAALQLGDARTAIQLIGEAIAVEPGAATAHCNLGSACKAAGDLAQARACYEQAIALEPDHAQAWHNRGVVLALLGDPSEALTSYERALDLVPDYPDAWLGKIRLLQAEGDAQAGLAACDGALALSGDLPEIHSARGNALRSLLRPLEALAAYDKVLALHANDAAALANRGSALLDLGRYAEAAESLDAAARLGLDHAELHRARGQALAHLKRYETAVEAYERTLLVDPESEFNMGMLLFTRMRICDWRGIDETVAQLEAGVEQGKRVTPPFPPLIFSSSPQVQAGAARIYAAARFPPGAAAPPLRAPDGKIRIGYYSADFHDHATAWLLAEVLEAHDAAQFEVYGFSFGPDQKDSMRRRISSAMHRFIDARAIPDAEIARMSREIGIDIAVDLKGYTQDSRCGVLAARCAPVQVNFLGFPGTMGAAYLDYIVADRTVLPADHACHFDEQPVWLPHCYQPNDSHRRISVRVFNRKEAGLPETGFVFACFNNNFKILPAMFDVWMRILAGVDESVLWLLQDNPAASDNLRREARARGIDPDRLVFAPRMALAEHLARHRLAGLFLDTLPCNAHTTASDALWAGLPLLTCLGNTFAGRVSASLLRALGMDELVAPSLETYESLAIELAHDPARLGILQSRLGNAVKAAPLFDGKLYARHLEAAYREMVERCRAGLAAVPIIVSA